MRVDVAARRVYLPLEGWLAEDTFWDIYYHTPHLLPGMPDFAALLQLGHPGRTGASN